MARACVFVFICLSMRLCIHGHACNVPLSIFEFILVCVDVSTCAFKARGRECGKMKGKDWAFLQAVEENERE